MTDSVMEAATKTADEQSGKVLMTDSLIESATTNNVADDDNISLQVQASSVASGMSGIDISSVENVVVEDEA